MDDDDGELRGRAQDLGRLVEDFKWEIEKLAREDVADVADFDPSLVVRYDTNPKQQKEKTVLLPQRGLEIYLTRRGDGNSFHANNQVTAQDVNRFMAELTNHGTGADRGDASPKVQVSMNSIMAMMENLRTLTWALATAVRRRSYSDDNVVAHTARVINALANHTNMSAVDLGTRAVRLLREFAVKQAHKPILDKAAKEKGLDGDKDSSGDTD